jgi:hypothetical protein
MTFDPLATPTSPSDNPRVKRLTLALQQYLGAH